MATKRQVKKAVKVAKRMSPKALFLAILFIIIVFAGYYVYDNYFKLKVEAKGELSFHFMTLGNNKSGDAIYVKAGNNDILIDGGSDTDSVDDIKDYIDKYVTDKTLEYVIVTHSDADHISCFAGSADDKSIFDLYEVGVIIDFPKTNKTGEEKLYKSYIEKRQSEIDDGNTLHYTALECYNQTNGAKRIYELTDDGSVKMEILYNYYYDHESSDENNYSVCLMFHHGSDKQFIFTGDLEYDGEKRLAEKYDFEQVELYKAGHHGSKTSSTDSFLSEIKPKICVVCCSVGYNQYNAKPENVFPTQAFINRIAIYTKEIYIPTIGDKNFISSGNYEDFNGDIVVISEGEKEVYVECSNNNTILKESNWFKENRTWPSNGK